METFTLTLPDSTVLSGRHNLPDATNKEPIPHYRPLVVGLHGGTYASSYFDATTTYSVCSLSSALSVPFVAIDRPGYGETTPVALGSSDGDCFPEAWGRKLHQSILPVLWRQFGQPRGCNCIVLHCHSFGVNGAIVSAALHADDPEPGYPLGGLVVSGFGSAIGIKDSGGHGPPPATPPTHISIPVAVKDSTLLLPGTAADEVYAQGEQLDHPMPFAEIACLRTPWLATWKKKWGVRVVAPIQIGLAGRDHYWLSTEEHLRDFAASFSNSTRVDASILSAAPHNIELSYWSPGWYARSFGFALECAASFAVKGS